MHDSEPSCPGPAVHTYGAASPRRDAGPLEYLSEHPEGYRYPASRERYRAWQKRLGLWMRQVHVAGEKALVDYSGKRPSVIDSTTGERVYVELFVGVLGASNLTYAEATPTQRVPDFLGSHVRMFECFGGVTQIMGH